MPVITVKARGTGDSVTYNGDFTRNYTRIFQVLATADTGMKAVVEALGISIGDAYTFGTESDSKALCNSISATHDARGNPDSWTATVQYGQLDVAQAQENPLLRQPEISFNYAQYEKPVFFDRDGNPLVNTAGVPFLKPYMVEDSRRIMELVRNEPQFDPDMAEQFMNHVNMNQFFGAAPGKVKCSNIKPSRQYSNELEFHYWVVAYEFKFNYDGWAARLLNEGYLQRNAAGTNVVPIYKDGQPIQTPALLDNAGHVLALDQDPIELTFDVLPEADFSQLGFDAFYGTLIGL